MSRSFTHTKSAGKGNNMNNGLVLNSTFKICINPVREKNQSMGILITIENLVKV